MSRRTLLILFGLIALAGFLGYFIDPTMTLQGWVRGETFFESRPSSFWASAINSTDPVKKDEAIRKLGDSKADSIAVLIEMIDRNTGTDHGPISVRTESLYLLAKTHPGNQQALDALLRSLNDPDPNVRVVALKGLDVMKLVLPDSAVSRLIELLSDREKVPPLRALAKFGNRAEVAIPEVRKLLQDPDPDVKWNASRTLGKIGPASIVALVDLFPHFEDASEEVREHAAETVGQIGPAATAAVPYLEKALTDPSYKVRRDAARSLGQIGQPAAGALPKMMPLLQDPNELVREAARKAIRIIDPKADVEGKK